MNTEALAVVLAAPVSTHHQDARGFHIDHVGLERDRQLVDLIRLAAGFDLLYVNETGG